MTEQLSMPTGEEIPGEKYFHHIISRAHNINMTVLICWYWPRSPGWPSVSGFSTVKLFFLPLKKEVTMHYPQGKSPFILLLVLFFSQTQSLSIFFFSSTSLLLPTHLPPPSCTHAQSRNPLDFSLPDSSVHGFFQARILEWVAISFSKSLSILNNHSLAPNSTLLVLRPNFIGIRAHLSQCSPSFQGWSMTVSDFSSSPHSI